MKQEEWLILGACGIGAYLLMTGTSFGQGLTRRALPLGALAAGAKASDSVVSGNSWSVPFGGQLVVPFTANAGSPMMVNNNVPSWNDWSWIKVK